MYPVDTIISFSGHECIGEWYKMFTVKKYELDSRHVDLVAVLGADKVQDNEYLAIGSNDVIPRLKWSDLDQETKDKYNKERSLQRTKSKVRRLCISQNMSYMWTLTFATKFNDVKGVQKDAGDLDHAWDFWRAFIKRCSRAGLAFDYIVTVEVQEKRLEKYGEKVYHFHFVTNKMMAVNAEIAKDMKKDHNIEDLWGYGNVFVSFRQKTQKSMVARYITKYISKMFDETGKATHRYRCSKGMVIPCEKMQFQSEIEIDMYMNKMAMEKGLHLKKEYYPLNNGDIEVLVYILAPRPYLPKGIKNKTKRKEEFAC